jgi:hypothetical protein
MSGGGGGGGKTGIDLPSFSNVDLTPGMESSGAAIANRYSQLGLGNSTMETQDENANVQRWDTQQAELNNQFAQQSFQDQLQAQNASGSGGFLAGLGSLGSILA